MPLDCIPGGIELHQKSLAPSSILAVGNIRCEGNDLRFGFYTAEWNSLNGDTMFVLSGDEDR